MRIRHFGFLANCVKTEPLVRARESLSVEAPPPSERKTAAEWILLLTGTDLNRCPHCGHCPLIRTELHPVPDAFTHGREPAVLDSS